MLNELKDFLKNPKTFLYADFLAMIPKLGLSLFFGVTLSILLRENLCLPFLIISYPFVALFVDVLLYLFRNRLWQPLPDTTIIPPEWDISATKLEQYAKNLPKARLMRVVTSFALMLLFIPLIIQEKNIAMTVFGGFVFLFFISALFDPIWYRFFKIEKPRIFKPKYRSPAAQRAFIERERRDQFDPSIAGTMAWLAKRHDK